MRGKSGREESEMSATATQPAQDTAVLSPARGFALHLWAFSLPLITTVFLATGPHSWWAALLWFMPIWVLVYCDVKANPDHRQPDVRTPEWPFNGQVWALAILQIVNHILLGFMASKLSAG